MLKGTGAQKYKVLELDTLDGIINSVEAGVGVTLLPVELIKKHYSFRNLMTVPISPEHSKCQTVFIRRKDFPVREEYALFLQSVINGYTNE